MLCNGILYIKNIYETKLNMNDVSKIVFNINNEVSYGRIMLNLLFSCYENYWSR